MKCGVLSFLRQISVGFGWRWIIRPAKYWPIHLANARMKSSFQKLLEPFSITMFFTDDWGSYARNLPPDSHIISKNNTQTIERKNLSLRTHIKRLCRKTICFSKSVEMHDIVIGLVINIWEFGFVYSPNDRSCT